VRALAMASGLSGGVALSEYLEGFWTNSWNGPWPDDRGWEEPGYRQVAIRDGPNPE
jgi:hypothetical protein